MPPRQAPRHALHCDSRPRRPRWRNAQVPHCQHLGGHFVVFDNQRQFHRTALSGRLRRFAAVSPFCFGYPAQPDIASWRIHIIHNHFAIDRPTLFFATRRQGRYPRSLEAFFFTPVDFLSVSRHVHDARAPLERTKDVDFRRVQLSTEWCLKARNESGGNVDDVDRSTSRRVGSWSIFWTSPELFSAVVSGSFPFLCWWTWRMSSRSFTTEEVDSCTRLLLEQTTSSPRCRSGECIHNQLVSISLAVLFFNLHFRCLALMH